MSNGKILIVDDNPTNLDVLFEYLDGSGFEIYVAEDGESALEQTKYGKPDIILLDVMMPGINGLETCRRLKSRPEHAHIPVIFMTALSDPEDKVKGFQAGAVDYVTKPFQHSEVLARVQTHLKISQLQNALQKANDELEQRVEDRTQELRLAIEDLKATQDQLVEMEKMAALGNLVAGVAHEINTPIGIGVSMASLLADKTETIIETFKTGKVKVAVLKEYLQTAGESSTLILNNLRRSANLVKSLKTVAVDQASMEQRTFVLKDYIEDILLNLSHELKHTNHTINIEGDPDFYLNSYPGAFAQIISNLIMNSLRHAYKDNDTGHIQFTFAHIGKTLTFEYADDGCGIPPENMSRIFEPFFTTARGYGGSGLGLNIIYKLVTETLHGSIQCDSYVGPSASPVGGTKFSIQIPLNHNS